MTRENLTQEQQKLTNEVSTPETLRAQLVTKGSELTEDQLDEVVGGIGMGWDDGKVRCSCGSTDVEELEPEEINHQTHATVRWYRCRKCRREFCI